MLDRPNTQVRASFSSGAIGNAEAVEGTAISVVDAMRNPPSAGFSVRAGGPIVPNLP